MSLSNQEYDVLVIGGGPAGATSAMQLARSGASVLVLEKSTFPRFHVGESFLPANFNLIRELGLMPALERLPRMTKLGAEFAMGNETETSLFSFADGLDGGKNETINLARAGFDAMILDAAREAGADVVEGTGVKKIRELSDGRVVVEADGRLLTAKYLIDASGQATVVGRHLGTRRVFENHRKIAYFGHFENVKRLSGREAGYPTVAMCDEGWFWMIPIDDRRTSVGLVMDADAARNAGVAPNQMLAWGIARCPLVRDRTANAIFPESNHVNADFSYTCEPYAGPGYFLVGDSAVFLDPVFSSGIFLGMAAAVEAAAQIRALLDGTTRPAVARRRYVKLVRTGSDVFFDLVNLFYEHSFRELFLHGKGPLKVEKAIISILAGHVLPKLAFSLRWRLWLFKWSIRLNRIRSIVTPRARFSLLSALPVVESAPVEAALSGA